MLQAALSAGGMRWGCAAAPHAVYWGETSNSSVQNAAPPWPMLDSTNHADPKSVVSLLLMMIFNCWFVLIVVILNQFYIVARINYNQTKRHKKIIVPTTTYNTHILLFAFHYFIFLNSKFQNNDNIFVKSNNI
jgi:hypothetical protein